MKISAATIPASCVTPCSLSMVLASAVAIDNTIVISPGERGALTAVVVVGGVVGVVVIGRVAAHVVIGGIVGVVVV